MPLTNSRPALGAPSQTLPKVHYFSCLQPGATQGNIESHCPAEALQRGLAQSCTPNPHLLRAGDARETLPCHRGGAGSTLCCVFVTHLKISCQGSVCTNGRKDRRTLKWWRPWHSARTFSRWIRMKTQMLLGELGPWNTAFILCLQIHSVLKTNFYSCYWFWGL